MTHGKLWPAHPMPFKDELLSSWIVRVVQANGIKLQTLSRMLFGENLSPWMRDIDRTPPIWLINSFCKHTGVDRKTALQTTLRSYKNRLFSKNRVSGHQQWILTVRQTGAKREAYGQQFCPACLESDSIPYFRKQWRVAFYTYCPIHHFELHDSCPNCAEPVIYYRVDFGRDVTSDYHIYDCHVCGYDLRKAKRITVYFPSKELDVFFDSLLMTLRGFQQELTIFNLGFLNVMHQICKVMGTRQNQGKLLEFVMRQLSLHNSKKTDGRITIEERRRDERHVWLLCALWLLIEPQHRIKEAWSNKVVKYSQLTKDFERQPMWFNKIVQGMSDWRNP